METRENFLQEVRTDPAALGIYLEPPLSKRKLMSTRRKIQEELGLVVPNEYMRLLHITDGIQTQRGYLSSLEEIGKQNAILWFMKSISGANAEGFFQIKYEPLETPRSPTYLWLGYDGNSSQQVYDIAKGEFHRRGVGGDGDEPDNEDRTLVGMLRHMIYGR